MRELNANINRSAVLGLKTRKSPDVESSKSRLYRTANCSRSIEYLKVSRYGNLATRINDNILYSARQLIQIERLSAKYYSEFGRFGHSQHASTWINMKPANGIHGWRKKELITVPSKLWTVQKQYRGLETSRIQYSRIFYVFSNIG